MRVNRKGKKALGGVSSYQLGGLNLPDLSNIQNIDWTNYDSVLQGAANVGQGNLIGDNLPNAIGQDNPDLLYQSLIPKLAVAQANNNPLYTPDQIEEEAKRRTFLGIGKRRAVRKLQAENQAYNTNQAGIASKQATGTFGQGQGLLDLLGLIGQFQDGGMVSKMGYADHSPFKHAPHLVINGGKIDMSNTSMDLKLIPDVGKPKIAKANSGIHNFPKASKVLEIPQVNPSFYRNGGIVEGEHIVDSISKEEIKKLSNLGYKVEIIND